MNWKQEIVVSLFALLFTKNAPQPFHSKSASGPFFAFGIDQCLRELPLRTTVSGENFEGLCRCGFRVLCRAFRASGRR